MQNFISVGDINIKLLIPIIGGLIHFIYQKLSSYTKLFDYPLVSSLCTSSGLILSIIPYLIQLFIMRKSRKIKNHQIKEKHELLKKVFLIMLTSIFDFSQTVLINFAFYSFISKMNLNYWACDIIYLSIFGYYFLKFQLYRHQFLSLVIMITLSIILDFFVGDLKIVYKGIIYCLLRVLVESFFSLEFIINKYLIEYKFLSPYIICFFIGLITSILFLVLLFFSTQFPCNYKFCTIKEENESNIKYVDNYKIYWKNADIKEIIYFIVFMIITCLYNISLLLTLKFFQPCHILIILVIGRIIRNIDNVVTTQSDNGYFNYIFNIIMYFLIFIDLLIYNELLELNFCGLELNIKRNIKDRARRDSYIDYYDDIDNEEEQNSYEIDGRNIKIETNNDGLGLDDITYSSDSSGLI